MPEQKGSTKYIDATRHRHLVCIPIPYSVRYTYLICCCLPNNKCRFGNKNHRGSQVLTMRAASNAASQNDCTSENCYCEEEKNRLASTDKVWALIDKRRHMTHHMRAVSHAELSSLLPIKRTKQERITTSITTFRFQVEPIHTHFFGRAHWLCNFRCRLLVSLSLTLRMPRVFVRRSLSRNLQPNTNMLCVFCIQIYFARVSAATVQNTRLLRVYSNTIRIRGLLLFYFIFFFSVLLIAVAGFSCWHPVYECICV